MNDQQTPTYCAFPKCNKELVHKPWKRKKKYCSQSCNNKHWLSINPQYERKSVRVPVEEYEELKKYKEAALSNKNNSGGKKDEDNTKKEPLVDIPSQIAKYEEEKKLLPDTPLGKARKKWIENKIMELKRSIKESEPKD